MTTAGPTPSRCFHDAMPRLVAAYAQDVAEEGWALGCRFVLCGPQATPFEAPREGQQ